LVVTLILSVLCAIIFTSLVASLLSPSQLQKYDPPITEQTKTITEQNDTKIQPANPDDATPPIELIEPTDD
jgi:hypothetical protein